MRPKLISAAALLLVALACPARAQQPERPDVYRLSLPGKAWALDVNLGGFKVYALELETPRQRNASKAGRSDPDGDNGPSGVARVLYASHKLDDKKRFFPDNQLIIRMEPARLRVTAEAWREARIREGLKSRRFSKDSVRQVEHKQFPLVAFTLPEYDARVGMFPTYNPFPGGSPFPLSMGGVPLAGGRWKAARGVEAFVVHDDTWISLRFVSSEHKDGGEQLLRSLLDSLKIVDTANPTTSFDFYQLGRAHVELKEYGPAVEALSQALALERQKRELSQPDWRQLVMTLANARGATDDVLRAREVLEYGAAAEPTYAFFHHGLARLHAYLGDLDAAIASLDKAYEHAPQDAYFITWPMYEPTADAAFKKFKDVPKFRDAVKAMKKRHKK